MRIPRKILATVMLAATAAGLTALPASAAGSAYLSQNNYLDNYAPVGSAPICVHRTIFIAKGNYLWSEFVDRLSEWDSRTIYLREDTYTWTVCIQVVGKYSYNVSKYQETSRLRGSAGGEATPLSALSYLGSSTSASRTYNWGSQLLPLDF
ncbi:hypothetical protein [Kribbella monticola]|uniref:hypothetical protein n=1 Tax=Kribbella monticola TaxID=2185285 RepID=UPI000DD4E984|nr:hypothetical protein [Kribbella monticola]